MKKNKQYIAHSLEELFEIAKQVAAEIKDSKIVLFEGEMGAGKTTFIAALCQVFGVEGTVQSPTFSIVNEYQTTQKETIYHFDAYRLKSPFEALDFGVEEYFYSGNQCFIEWSSKLEGLIPEEAVTVFITEQNQQEREIRVIFPKI